MEKLTYRDCRNYAPVDVTKGIDLLTKEIVLADDEAPAGYEPVAKCKNCKSFKETDAYMGVCEASMCDPKFFAYPDMIATTCNMFKAE